MQEEQAHLEDDVADGETSDRYLRPAVQKLQATQDADAQ